ncbi:MAG: hypothetical protein JWO08_496 [Verrucomicrobiaceae bacterium]|nr:hypothetical protein [Verrucomicrobiaceae bacterium]
MNKPKKLTVSCEHCSLLQKEFPILGPEDLTEAIRQAQTYVANGILVEVPFVVQNRSPFPLIVEIKAEGPWDDLMGFTFRCAFCDRRYYLGAETYHGSGGSWGPAK